MGFTPSGWRSVFIPPPKEIGETASVSPLVLSCRSYFLNPFIYYKYPNQRILGCQNLKDLKTQEPRLAFIHEETQALTCGVQLVSLCPPSPAPLPCWVAQGDVQGDRLWGQGHFLRLDLTVSARDVDSWGSWLACAMAFLAVHTLATPTSVSLAPLLLFWLKSPNACLKSHIHVWEVLKCVRNSAPPQPCYSPSSPI